jgi:hypothetical protein
MPTGTVSRTVHVAATPQAVFDLVSDLPGMGRLSPENTGGSWVGGSTGPGVGARFKGTNAQGKLRWSTAVEVITCDPGKEFTFKVTSGRMSVSSWAYTIAPEGDGCQVTETWTDHRKAIIKIAGKIFTGVSDREAFTGTSIEETLAALKGHAEAA